MRVRDVLLTLPIIRAFADDNRPKCKSYAEFEPQYFAAHTNPKTRRVHWWGGTIGIATGVLTTALELLVLGPAYGALTSMGSTPLVIAGIYKALFWSHRHYQNNEPETFRHPWWSVKAYGHMWWLETTGQFDDKLTKYSIAHKET